MLENHLIMLIGVIFVLVFVFGRIFEKIHIPWIFVALLLGMVGSSIPFVQKSLDYDWFKMLSFLAMNFLLFLIWFEIDLKKIKKLGKFIVRSSFVIILSEAFILWLLIYLFFGLSLWISALIWLSFATVGEAILIPILDSLKITKTNLGQAILWVATMDDIFEVLSVVIVVAVLPILINSQNISISVSTILLPISVLVWVILLWISIISLVKKMSVLKKIVAKYRFFLSMVIFFLFVGLGSIADMSAIGAIVGWIVASEIINKNYIAVIETQVKNIAYYFLGPIFFFAIGADVDLQTFREYLPLILVFSVVPYLIKVFVSYLNWRKILWKHRSIYMGIALWVRFSTSIVILTLFLEKWIISDEIFSVLISTTIVLKFVIPLLLSFLAKKWNIVEEDIGTIELKK